MGTSLALNIPVCVERIKNNCMGTTTDFRLARAAFDSNVHTVNGRFNRDLPSMNK